MSSNKSPGGLLHKNILHGDLFERELILEGGVHSRTCRMNELQFAWHMPPKNYCVDTYLDASKETIASNIAILQVWRWWKPWSHFARYLKQTTRLTKHDSHFDVIKVRNILWLSPAAGASWKGVANSIKSFPFVRSQRAVLTSATHFYLQ